MLVTPASHEMSQRASWWLCWLGRHACVCYAPLLPWCAPQDLTTFTFILTSLELGLKSTDASISSSCASAVDDLAGYYFRHLIQV